MDPSEAYRPSSEWWGWHVSPVALIVYVCETCGCRSEWRRCPLCEEDMSSEL
jgi:rubrerythrin